jgi:ATP-dependent exoDNAse (exonuclease V) alpha subunit
VKSSEIRDLLLKNLNLTPTQDQYRFIKSLSAFLNDEYSERIFILRGYAGTGKTTLVKTITQSLPRIKMKSVLLAPTGRAAKVLGKYSGLAASTIHRRIYAQESKNGRDFTFRLAHNKSVNTLFIVDEASMISGKTQYEGNMYAGSNLLEDLLHYVYDGENCKLLFLGDVAQLPPISEKVSPALSPKLFQATLGQRAMLSELQEVLRQAKDSGILNNATQQRELLIEGEVKPQLIPNNDDVIYLDGYNLEEALQTAYSEGMEETMVITRSNKSANQFNQQIRNRILYREAEIETEDLLMVVKNNYYWLDAKSKAGFIANGDIVEILSLGNIEEHFGFRFLKCDVRMLDYPQQEPFEVVLNLNALYSESPALTQQEQEKLYNAVLMKYADVRDKRLLFLKIKEDPYFNALQVKFAYAITCHKAQGGQWKHVFVEHGYVTPEHLGTEFMRWIYTAITRASEKLYLVNFKEEFVREE